MYFTLLKSSFALFKFNNINTVNYQIQKAFLPFSKYKPAHQIKSTNNIIQEFPVRLKLES